MVNDDDIGKLQALIGEDKVKELEVSIRNNPLLLIHGQNNRYSPLSYAVNKNSVACAEVLLRCFHDPAIRHDLIAQKPANVEFPLGEPMYWKMASSRLHIPSVAMIQCLYQHGFDLNFFGKTNGETLAEALLHEINNDLNPQIYLSLLQKAVECGLDVPSRDKTGRLTGASAFETFRNNLQLIGSYSAGEAYFSAVSPLIPSVLKLGVDCRLIQEVAEDAPSVARDIMQQLEPLIMQAKEGAPELTPKERANILCGIGALPGMLRQWMETGDHENFHAVESAMHPVWREEYRHQLQAAEAVLTRRRAAERDSALNSWVKG